MASYYLKIVFIVFASFMMLVGGFNFSVDPFGLFSVPTIKGFNAEKTELNKHLLLTKAHAVRFYKPGGIILGTSRAEYGLDPQHQAWNSSAQPIYNLGLSNGRIEEAFLFLKHAHAHGNLKQVVLGADFFMFGDQFRLNTGFDRTRLSQTGDNKVDTGWIKDILNSLFTLDALFASIETIKSQGKGESVLYLSNGMRSSEDTWQQVLAKGGHHAAFLADIRHDLRYKAGLAAFTLGETDNRPSPTLDIFADLVRFCLEQNIELKVIISPIHVYKLEVLYQLGLWELYEYWKLRLTTIVETENQRMPGSFPVEIWDFSVYNSITTESVPGKNESDIRMNWYWEGSHYHSELGDKLLNCIFDVSGSVSDDCSLGKKLNPMNISEHLFNIRNAGEQYRMSHKKDIIMLKTLIQETEGERNKLRIQTGWKSSKYAVPVTQK